MKNRCNGKKKFIYYFPWNMWKKHHRCSLLLNYSNYNVSTWLIKTVMTLNLTVVLNVSQSWINGAFFQPSHLEVYWAFAWFTVKMPHLLFEKCVHIYTTQSTTRQSEANWKRWPLLNHITGYHISFFIGQKWSTSVSTWLSFHTKHLNRDSSPISVAPLRLFKPACVSHINPQRLLCCFVPVCSWRGLMREHGLKSAKILSCLHRDTVCFKWFVYVVRSFNTQLIWQLCKPEPNVPTLGLAFF